MGISLCGGRLPSLIKQGAHLAVPILFDDEHQFVGKDEVHHLLLEGEGPDAHAVDGDTPVAQDVDDLVGGRRGATVEDHPQSGFGIGELDPGQGQQPFGGLPF